MSQRFETASQLRAYRSSVEYFQDQLVVLDLIIEAEIQRMSQQHSKQAEQPGLLQGMYVSDTEAHQMLLQHDEHIQLDEQQQALITQLEYTLMQRLQAAVLMLPIQRLKRQYHLDELDCRVITLAIAPQLHRKYIRLFGYLQDDLTCQYATLDLILRLCARSQEERDTIYYRMMNSESNLAQLFSSFQSHATTVKEVSCLSVPLALKSRIVHYLLGLPWQYEGPLSGARHEQPEQSTELPAILIHEQLQLQLWSFIQAQAEQSLMIALIGASGSGKTLQSRHIASKLRKSLLVVDAARIATHDDLNDAIKLILQEAKLLDAILIIEQAEKLSSAGRQQTPLGLTDQLQACLVKQNQLVMLHSTSELPFQVLPNLTSISIQIPLPTLDQSSMLWRYYSEPHVQLSHQLSLQLASKFQFTAGQIAATIMRSKQLFNWEAAGREAIAPHEYHSQQQQAEQSQQPYWQPQFSTIIERAAYQMIYHGLQDKAVKMHSRWTWNDLVLPADTLSLLKQACLRLEHRHTVMQAWGFDRLLPYGRGISMLFTGPPGTGKTMSALVMAKAMSTELYRVDLTRVVSKYIGETEKNLAEIFDRAALSGAILFFDEADALFGKRSEVKDSHDKYANMETSYLLQKMEEYDGLTILATNFSQNLDEAFMRRIHYIIKFPFPDAEQREQLWRSVLPDKLPCEELDLPFLAKTFELAGGPIKNIVLTAAYLAAEEQSSVTMKHMIEAAVQEYKKTGKLLMKERLGQYAHFWKG